MDRVAASEAAGRWFESSRARHLILPLQGDPFGMSRVQVVGLGYRYRVSIFCNPLDPGESFS